MEDAQSVTEVESYNRVLRAIERAKELGFEVDVFESCISLDTLDERVFHSAVELDCFLDGWEACRAADHG